MTGLVYLASPYSHADPAERDKRFRQACVKAAQLMEAGNVVFAPIAHSHAVAAFMAEGMATDHAFWMAQDLPILRRSDKLVVLMLDGWRESKGVRAELAAALACGIPVEFIDP